MTLTPEAIKRAKEVITRTMQLGQLGVSTLSEEGKRYRQETQDALTVALAVIGEYEKIQGIDNKIAEIFYEQLKGLYAAGPIEALEAIKDMIDDRDAKIANLQATLKTYREALENADEYFTRHHASGNFMGDEEHETWKSIKNALKEGER